MSRSGRADEKGPQRAIGIGTVFALSVTLLSCEPAAESDTGVETAVGVELSVGGLGLVPGRFKFPRCVAVDDRDGAFWVVDRTGRIQRFDARGELLQSWEMPEHEFGQPVGLAVEEDGHLIVSDSHYHRLVRFRPDGSELLASWGEKGRGPGQLWFGRDVSIDSEGNFYIGDYGGENDRIQKWSRKGEFLLEWGRQGSAPGEFDRIQGTTIERRRERELLLVADCSNHRVQRFELDGRLVDLWGELGTGPGQLKYPSSVAVAPDGTVLVCEWGNNRVQRFDVGGRSLGTWGGPGRSLGELATPWDVEVGRDGRVFVVDYGNHRVQVFRMETGFATRNRPPTRGAGRVEDGISPVARSG